MRRLVLTTLAAASALPLALGGPQVGARTSFASFDRVVTLGDSYASGMGIHRDASDYDDHGAATQSFSPSSRLGNSACHRELDTTPGARLAEQLGADAVMVACAGAVIDDVERQLAAADIRGDGAGTLALLTVSGNDLATSDGDAWPDVLVRCITSHRCDRDDENQLANLPEVQDRLTRLAAAIGDEYPLITLRVVGYPRLMQRERWGCPGVTGMGRPEADWIDEQVDRFNAVIAAAVDEARAATGADLRFVAVDEEFDNHGACRFWQRDRYVNDSLLGETLSRHEADDGTIDDDWSDGLVSISGSSFHPSQRGYDAFTRAVAADLGIPSPA